MPNDLETIAKQLVEKPKGILAADESVRTIENRFANVGITGNTEEDRKENRRAYREMLFTTPDLENYINGVIMNEETLTQRASDGRLLIDVLRDKGIIPGVKVDKGTVDMPYHAGEKITEGLDGLRARLEEYAKQGAKFTKWRAVYSIGDGKPSEANIHANAYGLAMYAVLSQEQGLVPIPEPEVLIDGSHSISACSVATSNALGRLFEYLKMYDVNLKGIVLKPNMIVHGSKYPKRVERYPEKLEIADIVDFTIRGLEGIVPFEVPGIAFLSGGLDENAVKYLNAMNSHLSELKRCGVSVPLWNLTFSFARALQNAAMKGYKEFLDGNPDGIRRGQEKLLEEARKCSLATLGQYTA